MKQALKPGITETQLWGILNYTNLANHGEWHDGRMLASGPRINPWLQEASQRPIESGDLVGFDTDMVGRMGYFCDISRTFHCGPKKPSKRQKKFIGLRIMKFNTTFQLIKKTWKNFSKFKKLHFQSQKSAKIMPTLVFYMALECVMNIPAY